MRYQTPLRTQLNAIRNKTEETATKMAERLGVSRAFLNYIEVGQKNAPQELLIKVREEYSLSQDEYRDLCHAAEISPQTCRLDVSDLSFYQRQQLQQHIIEYRERGRRQEVEGRIRTKFINMDPTVLASDIDATSFDPRRDWDYTEGRPQYWDERSVVHIGQTSDDLLERILTKRQEKAASTFRDEETAEIVIKNAISMKNQEIARWVCQDYENDLFTINTDIPWGSECNTMGWGIKHDLTEHTTNTVHILLARECEKEDNPLGFVLVQAWPDISDTEKTRKYAQYDILEEVRMRPFFRDDIERITALYQYKTPENFDIHGAPQRANGDPPTVTVRIRDEDEHSDTTIYINCEGVRIRIFTLGKGWAKPVAWADYQKDWPEWAKLVADIAADMERVARGEQILGPK